MFEDCFGSGDGCLYNEIVYGFNRRWVVCFVGGWFGVEI